MRAILSDIHANLEALNSVLADIEQHEVDEIICLGDVIGYGPDPQACLDMVMDFDIVLLGNHENALMVDMNGMAFNDTARRAVEWTRKQLDLLDSMDRDGNARRWDFLGSLKDKYEEDDTLFVHGSPRQPTMEYIYFRDIYHESKLRDIFQYVPHLCFVGHTHVPGVWTDDMVYISPHEANYLYRFTSKRTIVNVGSVGQPRNGDVRSSYVLQWDDMIEFRKVAYPVEKTCRKIHEEDGLEDFLADRLMYGR